MLILYAGGITMLSVNFMKESYKGSQNKMKIFQRRKTKSEIIRKK